MPTIALGNQALLHAMLALSAFHIAKLTNSPPMAAIKHYGYAIRKVAHSVSLPTRRGQPATLAATMLLGYYEVMNGEHQKWSNHLLGSQVLLNEIDFRGMTNYIKRQKKQQRNRQAQMFHHNMAMGVDLDYYEDEPEDVPYLPDDDVNENLVGMIMGKKLKYDESGQILDDVYEPSGKEKVYTRRDIEIYENQRDLFWWYAKQDAFQSILSGNRLL